MNIKEEINKLFVRKIKEMLKKNFSFNDIRDITGKSIKEIQEIKITKIRNEKAEAFRIKLSKLTLTRTVKEDKDA